jgi:hypothetical protein
MVISIIKDWYKNERTTAMKSLPQPFNTVNQLKNGKNGF